MFSFLTDGPFAPHGVCLSWDPMLLATHAMADAAMGLCYIAVGGLIFYFGRKRPDMGPAALFNSLGAVFALCGLVHFSDIVVLWSPIYPLQGGFKALAALASLVVLAVMVAGLPRAMAVPSPEQLRQVNAKLGAEVAQSIQRESRLRTLSRAVDQNPSMVIITNACGQIEYVNQAFEQITGYDLEEVRGLTPKVLKSPNTPAALHEDMWRAIVEGREWRGEMEDRAKDGRAFWVQASISPVRDDEGQITHYVSLEQDISARKLAEQHMAEARRQAEMANRAKTELLANMSHELRTPLNAIIGFSSTMQQGVFGPLGHAKYQEYAGDIHASGEHLLALINDILDVSAIEAGKLTLHEDEVSLRELILSSERLVEPRADKGKVVLYCQPVDDIRLTADPRRMKQVLLNLLSNAVKFTPEGGRVTVAAGLLDDGRLQLEVRDTGIGMDADGLIKAMQPFGQVDSRLQRKFEGTGLGLPLTQALVEAHGGQLALDSTPGQGTTARVILPANRVVHLAEA